PTSGVSAHRFACSRFFAQGAPNHYQYRSSEVRLRNPLWKVSDCCGDDKLIGPGGAGNRQRGRVWIKPFGGGPLDQRGERACRHVDRRGGRGIGKALPVEISRECTVLGMAGDILQPARALAVGERKAKLGGSTLCRRDTGHNLNRDVRRLARIDLFSRTAKYQSVTALSAHDALALPCQADHQGIDVFLLARGTKAGLADQ